MPSKMTESLRIVNQKSGAIFLVPVIICAAALVMLLNSSLQSSDQKRFDLAGLHGDWEGSGTFIMPVTEVEIDVEGQASFRYDPKTGKLRSALSGEKFMFTYSDSGYVTTDADGDSLTWEVWDGFGRHVIYRGAFEDNYITGSRRWKGEIFSVEITQPQVDTIYFKMMVTADDSTTTEKASFILKRVE